MKSDIPHPSYQVQPHSMPPETWTLTLNRYQRDNLLLLIQSVMTGDERPAGWFNTGDWVGEIRWMLGKKHHSGWGPGVEAIYDIDFDDHPNAVRALLTEELNNG